VTVAVITGLGVAAPNGVGTERYWAATLRGESGIGPLTRFEADRYPARLAGQIRGFDPERHLSGRLLPQTDRMTQLALCAGDWALTDAGIDPDARSAGEWGVVTANASGGFEYGQRELQNLWHKGGSYVSAYMSFAWFYAVNTGQLSIRHNLRGPTGVLVTEQAGAIDALGQARRQIRKGVRGVLTGGVDASLCPYGWVAQLAGGRLSTRSDPAGAFLPFDVDASGHVSGEGGAVLVVEEAAAARSRGARLYGEIAGYAATFDGRRPAAAGSGLRRAAELALADAGLTPADIGVVFADAAAVRDLDQAEAAAIEAVFGPRGVSVTAPKTMTGRLYSGAAVDVAAALLSLRDGVIPPTVNVRRVDPRLRIDLVLDGPRPLPRPAAMVLARGAGGFNAVAVLRSVRV
jgi:act minimal PKS chain-length factor (CLF/KS beta)